MRRRSRARARSAARSRLKGAGELDPRAHPELAVDVAQVRLDRARTQDELLGDLAVGSSRADQGGDLVLARGERAVAVVARRPQHTMAESSQLAHRLVAPSHG